MSKAREPWIILNLVNSDNSYLFRKLTGVSISGGLMPRRGSALSAAVIDSIRVWIENGALNN